MSKHQIASRALGCRPRRARSLVTAVMALLVVSAFATASAQADKGQGVGVTEVTCNKVTFSYHGFPEGENFIKVQQVKVDGVVVYNGSFSFNGSSGSNTVAITTPEGAFAVDAHAHWETNGYRGVFDHKVKIECSPSIAIHKEQRLDPVITNEFTTEPLVGHVGETVEYKITVTNTGNRPLELSELIDPNCEPGTITGGQAVLAPEETTVFMCSHVLTEGGTYTNEASISGTPEGGPPVKASSNVVEVYVPPEPGFTIAKTQEIAGTGSGFVTTPLVGAAGETVDYEITVTNTGNVPLTFGELIDANCGSIEGGPGASPVAPGASTTFTCDHLLTEHDATKSQYTNTATDTGTPPPGLGHSITHKSNTVIVNFKGHGKGEVGTEIGCHAVTFYYFNFPFGSNTIMQWVKVNGVEVSTTTFTFPGPNGSDTVEFEVPEEGEVNIDAHAKWNTNGVSGNIDHHVKITCNRTEP